MSTQQLIYALTTSVISIIGVITNSIISIRAHAATTQTVLNNQVPADPTAQVVPIQGGKAQ